MQQGSKIGNWLTKWFNLLIKQEQIEVFPTKQGSQFMPPQAPNREQRWSQSQKVRSEAMTGPRFTQKDMSAQPAPQAAIELLAKEPIIFTPSNKAICNGTTKGSKGGKGETPGHPQIFINLDDEAEYSACGYCGQRFQREKEQIKNE